MAEEHQHCRNHWKSNDISRHNASMSLVLTLNAISLLTAEVGLGASIRVAQALAERTCRCRAQIPVEERQTEGCL